MALESRVDGMACSLLQGQNALRNVDRETKSVSFIERVHVAASRWSSETIVDRRSRLLVPVRRASDSRLTTHLIGESAYTGPLRSRDRRRLSAAPPSHTPTRIISIFRASCLLRGLACLTWRLPSLDRPPRGALGHADRTHWAPRRAGAVSLALWIAWLRFRCAGRLHVCTDSAPRDGLCSRLRRKNRFVRKGSITTVTLGRTEGKLSVREI